MRPHTWMLSAATLSAATLGAVMAFATSARAADVMKEGTTNVAYSSFGTIKSTSVNKGLWLSTFDENGLTVGTGLTDHMTWHCFGSYDITAGVAALRGDCVATDPAGDQVVTNLVSDGKPAWDAKVITYTHTYATGTGKYTGISGGFKAVCHTGEFKPTAENTYLNYCTAEGSYKLP